MSDDRPPPNPQAERLRLSSEAYARLLRWLVTERSVIRAWIYGSRTTGIRREPVKVGLPDIDIVVSIAAEPVDEITERFRLRDTIALIGTETERFHLGFDQEGSQVRAWRTGGVMIFQR